MVDSARLKCASCGVWLDTLIYYVNGERWCRPCLLKAYPVLSCEDVDV